MGNLDGGFIAYRAISAEEQEMFNTLIVEVKGVKFEPFAVATQVVNGVNHAFFCRALQVGKDEIEAYNASVVIYEPIPGANERPRILRIKQVEVVEEKE